VVVADSEKAAEAQDSVRDFASHLIDHDARSIDPIFVSSAP
jgi:hypothetical protein